MAQHYFAPASSLFQKQNRQTEQRKSGDSTPMSVPLERLLGWGDKKPFFSMETLWIFCHNKHKIRGRTDASSVSKIGGCWGRLRAVVQDISSIELPAHWKGRTIRINRSGIDASHFGFVYLWFCLSWKNFLSLDTITRSQNSCVSVSACFKSQDRFYSSLPLLVYPTTALISACMTNARALFHPKGDLPWCLAKASDGRRFALIKKSKRRFPLVILRHGKVSMLQWLHPRWFMYHACGLFLSMVSSLSLSLSLYLSMTGPFQSEATRDTTLHDERQRKTLASDSSLKWYRFWKTLHRPKLCRKFSSIFRFVNLFRLACLTSQV